MDRMKQIKGFTTPDYLRETLIPKTKRSMVLPDKFSKKGINIMEEMAKDKQ